MPSSRQVGSLPDLSTVGLHYDVDRLVSVRLPDHPAHRYTGSPMPSALRIGMLEHRLRDSADRLHEGVIRFNSHSNNRGTNHTH